MQIIRNGQRVCWGSGNIGSDIAGGIGNVAPYNAEVNYRKGNVAGLEHGFAFSRTDDNLGNDPLTDEGNWILVLNGNRMVEWYGRNQTEELPTEEIGANQIVSSEGVIGFTGTAGGDESENGGVPGIVLSDISTVADADPTVSLAYLWDHIPASAI